MIMSKAAMKNTIKAILQSELGKAEGNTGAANAQIETISTAISEAVAAYVTQELTVLKTFLVTPGAFTGAGTGVVVVTAPGIAPYIPGIP
jgi:hypothetical protein